MDYLQFNLALNYAMQTYMRRDVLFVVSLLGEDKGKKDRTLIIEGIKHPKIDQYILENG
jgi:hypothetical protein